MQFTNLEKSIIPNFEKYLESRLNVSEGKAQGSK